MTFLAPWYLLAGVAAAAAIVALHFIARQRPRTAPLPTTRFIPERPVRAPSRSVWPTDLLLLALRVAVVLLVATAFARPSLTAERRATARIVLLDVSRAVASEAEAIDSARRHLQTGDRLHVFDTTARVLSVDSTGSARRTDAPGSISAALVAGAREARALAEEAERVEIVLVSPLAAEEVDSASAELAALAGNVRVVRVARAARASGQRLVLRASDDDPLRATLALLAADSGAGETRIVRDAPTAGDSAWARGGGTLVVWPRDTTDARAAAAAGITTGRVTLVASLAPRTAPPEGRAIARWADGAPAATEVSSGSGCVRHVAIPVPAAGDLVLRTPFVRLVRTLAEPCSGEPRLAAVPVERLVRQTPTASPPSSLSRPARSHRDLTAWLLAAALVLALGELSLRRPERTA